VDQRSERQVAVLRKAAEMIGGMANLAAFLAVPEDQLAAWVAPREAAPLWVFVQTNDLVADASPAPPRQSVLARRRSDVRPKRFARQ
jgi:hypothetical protein